MFCIKIYYTSFKGEVVIMSRHSNNKFYYKWWFWSLIVITVILLIYLVICTSSTMSNTWKTIMSNGSIPENVVNESREELNQIEPLKNNNDVATDEEDALGKDVDNENSIQKEENKINRQEETKDTATTLNNQNKESENEDIVDNKNTISKEETTNKEEPVTIDETKQDDITETEESTEVSVGKRNALSSAKQYLTYMSFSYQGLIEQLEYEGYTSEEAEYAVDNCGADSVGL